MTGLSDALRRQAEGIWAATRAARRFRGDLAPHRGRLAAAFLLSVAYTSTKVAEPWPLKVVLDNVIGGRTLASPFPGLNARFDRSPLQLLAAAAAAILVIALARGVLYYYQNLFTAEVGQSVVMAVRRRLFAHVQRLPMSFHSRSRTGDVLSRLTGDILLLRDLVV
ncbi:MAG: ABC transporter transmembrane domain-containing protein, partial [Anaerolineae bacterium]